MEQPQEIQGGVTSIAEMDTQHTTRGKKPTIRSFWPTCKADTQHTARRKNPPRFIRCATYLSKIGCHIYTPRKLDIRQPTQHTPTYNLHRIHISSSPSNAHPRYGGNGSDHKPRVDPDETPVRERDRAIIFTYKPRMRKLKTPRSAPLRIILTAPISETIFPAVPGVLTVLPSDSAATGGSIFKSPFWRFEKLPDRLSPPLLCFPGCDLCRRLSTWINCVAVWSLWASPFV